MRQKGFTLTEVLVSMAVFMVVFVSVLSCYTLAARGYAKQEEYMYFEAICLDIDLYYDTYENWQELYFNSTESTIYYDSNYQKVDTMDKYRLSIEQQTDNLIISIYNTTSGYYVIESLEYGGSNHA